MITEENSYFYRTKQHDAAYQDATIGLSVLSPGEPAHCGPHSYRGFNEAIDTFSNPNVFEIGFNLGHSAAMMLNCGASGVSSIDIRSLPKMNASAERLKMSYKGQFEVQFGVTVATCKPPSFSCDMAFIDGGHEYDDVIADILYCFNVLGIKKFLFDDWSPIYGPGVQRAIRDSDLLPLKIIGNMAICVVPEFHKYFRP